MIRRLLLGVGLLLLNGVLLWRLTAPSAPTTVVPLIPPLVRVPSSVDQPLASEGEGGAPLAGLGRVFDRLSRLDTAPEFRGVLDRFRRVASRGGPLGDQGLTARVALEADALAMADVLGDERVSAFILRKESVAREVRAEEWVWEDLLLRLR